MIVQWEQWLNDGNSDREQHEWWKGLARASRRTLRDSSHNKGARWKKKKCIFLATRDNGVKENTMGAKVERETVLFFWSDKGR